MWQQELIDANVRKIKMKRTADDEDDDDIGLGDTEFGVTDGEYDWAGIIDGDDLEMGVKHKIGIGRTLEQGPEVRCRIKGSCHLLDSMQLRR